MRVIELFGRMCWHTDKRMDDFLLYLDLKALICWMEIVILIHSIGVTQGVIENKNSQNKLRNFE